MKTTIYEYFVLTNVETEERIEFPFTETVYDLVKYINENMTYDEAFNWHVSLVTSSPELEVKLCQAFIFHGQLTIYMKGRL